jgi:aryl-alcohol dehydrogenase-like predicted oxidoreductase
LPLVPSASELVCIAAAALASWPPNGRDAAGFGGDTLTVQYTTLGQTGLIVSRLAFGAMTFSAGNRDIPALYNVEETIADRLVGQALDAGVNFFDTADVYAGGQSEEILGRALAPRRDQVVIATKVGGRTSADLNGAGLSRRHILASVDQSLKRLGTDWIDVYLVHRDDPFTPMEETLSALDVVVRAGKVRYLGFSNWSAWQVSAAMEIMKANGLAPFTHGQMHYSLLCRDIESEFVPMLRRYGLGLTVWSPLSGGYLSGKYRGTPESDARLKTFDMLPLNKAAADAVIDRLAEFAQGRGTTIPQVAIAWLLAKAHVTSVILGAAKPPQLADNLRARETALSADEVAVLDRATAADAPYPTWFLQRFPDQVLERALGAKT